MQHKSQPIVRIKYQNANYSFYLPNTFYLLIQQISTALKVDNNTLRNLTLTYKDDEGDNLTISNQSDYKIALDYISNNSISLFDINIENNDGLSFMHSLSNIPPLTEAASHGKGRLENDKPNKIKEIHLEMWKPNQREEEEEVEVEGEDEDEDEDEVEGEGEDDQLEDSNFLDEDESERKDMSRDDEGVDNAFEEEHDRNIPQSKPIVKPEQTNNGETNRLDTDSVYKKIGKNEAIINYNRRDIIPGTVPENAQIKSKDKTIEEQKWERNNRIMEMLSKKVENQSKHSGAGSLKYQDIIHNQNTRTNIISETDYKEVLTAMKEESERAMQKSINDLIEQETSKFKAELIAKAIGASKVLWNSEIDKIRNIENQRQNQFIDEISKINQSKASVSMSMSMASNVVHNGIQCGICKQSPIHGFRYKCSWCPDYNLCVICEEHNTHEHDFIKMKYPEKWGNISVKQRNYINNPISDEQRIDVIGNMNNWMNEEREEYSYQCRSRDLSFIIDRTQCSKFSIKLIIQNDGASPWKENKTKFVCDKFESTIIVDDIVLTNWRPNQETRVEFVLDKIIEIDSGDYKIKFYFTVNDIIYGEPLNIKITIIDKYTKFIEHIRSFLSEEENIKLTNEKILQIGGQTEYHLERTYEKIISFNS